VRAFKLMISGFAVSNEKHNGFHCQDGYYSAFISSAGLQSAFRNDWMRNLNICRVYEDGKYYACCRENNSGELCKDCGYLSYAEIDQTLKLKPGAFLNALKYF